MKKISTLWVTRTAVGTSLILIAQLIGKIIPTFAVIIGPFSVSQLVTGSLVNLLLILLCLIVGARSGVIVSIISAVLATLIGIGPIFPILTPLIAISNALLVITYYGFSKLQKKFYFYIALVVAALVKCIFLWCSVPIALSYTSNIPIKQRAMLTLMFSWPQALTALCGGILAAIIYPLLKNAKL